MSETVVVVGASPKQDRYSNMAVRLLKEHGHSVIPMNPAFDLIEELPTAHSLTEISQPVDTVTLYVNPARAVELGDALIALAPKRVIFNPGTESEPLRSRLEGHGIRTEAGCTLVMLKSGTF